MRPSNNAVASPIERHTAMTWAQRLKRVFNIEIETCSRCGGSVRVIACIEDQHIINKILAHLRDQEQDRPSNHDSGQQYGKIANLSGSATRSQEKTCSQHTLNTSLYLAPRSV